MNKFKLKPVDIILIFAISVAAIAFALYFFRTTKMVTIRVKVTDRDVLYARTNPNPWFAERFQVGDAEYDTTGRVISKILQVDKLNISTDQYNPEEIVYVTIQTKATYDSRAKSYTLKNQKLVYGSPVRFIFSTVQFDGIVTDVADLTNFSTTQTTIVEAASRDASRSFSDTYGVPEYLADAVKQGDSIIDSNGESLATILKVNKKPSVRSIVSNGKIINVSDPNLFDVTYTIQLKTKLVDHEPYFMDTIPIKIGNFLHLNFPQVHIWPTITKINP